MAIPLHQKIRVGSYVLGQHLRRVKRYPLVLMLEPLFRCNLACAGCGKIDYPDEILNQRLSVAECLDAIDECGAPIVVIAGGEPLLHREIEQIVEGMIARKKFVYLAPTRYCWKRKSTVRRSLFRLDRPPRRRQGRSRPLGLPRGVYDRGPSAAAGEVKGFRVNINATLFDNADPIAWPTSSTR